MMSLLPAALAVLLAIAAFRLVLRAVARRRIARLLEAPSDLPAGAAPSLEDEPWLNRWLARAGYREPSAPTYFLAATAAMAAIALAGIVFMNQSHLQERMVEAMSVIPGGIGDIFAFIAGAASYILFIIGIAIPTLVVRAARRSRVEAIEQDLAPALELLATLAEAGLGFDAAIGRIQESQSADRPLVEEFRIYQRDVLGGVSRLGALRALARRVDVTSVTIFISALVQAEEVGTSLSETLRTQADDLRDRRKLQALIRAQALPVKLVFPLMVCFLPGIFFSTLGPVLSQLVDVIDTVLKR